MLSKLTKGAYFVIIISQKKGDFLMPYNDYFITPEAYATINEKLAILKANNAKGKELKAEIKELTHAKVTDNNPTEALYNAVAPETLTFSNSLTNLVQKISLLDINALDENAASLALEKLIGRDLNSRSLSLLKMALFKEIIEYKELLLSCETNAEYNEILEQISALKRKITLLEYSREEEEIRESATTANNLYFLTSSLGNVYFIESIRKNVPEEYYQAFKNLLLTIKNGTFKGLKKLTGIPYFEVRDFKIRITFDRLEGNNFIILDAFMKKDDTSLEINKGLKNREKEITLNKANFKKALNNPEFKALHETYYEDIIQFLDSTTRKGGSR